MTSWQMCRVHIIRAAPHEQWKRIRTTNMLERLNKELKRRTRAIGAFANEASLLRLAGTILMDINEEWTQVAGIYLVQK